MRGRNPRR